MSRAGILPILFLLAACGSDIAGDNTAAVQRANEDARMAAQRGRVPNPEALACIRANASNDEWSVIATETGDAPAVLQTVLNREGTIRCFNANNVVVYI